MSQRPDSDQEMPLVSHLTELRTRLLRIVAAVFTLFAGLFYFSQDIYALVAAPLRAYLPEGATMIATGVASPFLTPFKLTMMVALFLAIPSILLFYGGMAFAYFVVFPIMFGFFASVTPEGVAMMTDIGQYLDFVLTLFFAFGVAFEIPIATFLLIWVGVVDVASLRKSRPYVIVGCFAVGMVLTPPDVFSQTLLAVPMWLLFEAGLLCGSLIKRRDEHGDEDPASEPHDQPPAAQP